MKENKILLTSNNIKLKDNIKIAGFDFDFTLVKTKSGKKFPVSSDDWTYWSDQVLPKLKELKSLGFILVIFSNQNGVGTGKIESEMVISRFQNFIDSTNLDWICIASTKKDLFRKPQTKMWNYLFQDYDINKEESFYVGDAAGRVKNYVKGRKKDFSCSDRKFAINLDLKFYTPDEFFHNEDKTDKFIIDGFNPLEYNLKPYQKLKFKKQDKELVIMIGCPGSGKSRFAKKYYKSYRLISQDQLKSKSKCLKLCQKIMEEGDSIIIDNTNPDKKTRKLYIDLALQNKYTIKCYWMQVDKLLGKHLNYIRFKKNEEHGLVPDIAYNVYFKRFEKPSEDELFNEIKIIEPNFKFNDNDKKLFMELN